MTTKVYADKTTVPVTKSRQDIEAMLRKAKANRVVHMVERLEAIVMFELAGRLVKIEVPIKGDATDQVRRSKWRALYLIIKAKIEAVAQGVTTVEQEWLAHIVLPDGRTVGQWIEPQLQVAYDRGDMPTNPLLLEGPKNG